MWEEAELWTQEWVGKWNDNCCRFDGKWTPKDKVPGGADCCDKATEASGTK